MAGQDYGIPVETCYEPEILGTGGALKNVAGFWDDQPFVVVNSDIFTDIDIARGLPVSTRNTVSPVTLVLCNDPEFNSVSLRDDGTIIDFSTDRSARTHMDLHRHPCHRSRGPGSDSRRPLFQHHRHLSGADAAG